MKRLIESDEEMQNAGQGRVEERTVVDGQRRRQKERVEWERRRRRGG